MEKRNSIIVIVSLIIVLAFLSYVANLQQREVTERATTVATTTNPGPSAAISEQIGIPNPFTDDYQNPFE
jgi:Tfp pilus assembly protein FimT